MLKGLAGPEQSEGFHVAFSGKPVSSSKGRRGVIRSVLIISISTTSHLPGAGRFFPIEFLKTGPTANVCWSVFACVCVCVCVCVSLLFMFGLCVVLCCVVLCWCGVYSRVCGVSVVSRIIIIMFNGLGDVGPCGQCQKRVVTSQEIPNGKLLRTHLLPWSWCLRCNQRSRHLGILTSFAASGAIITIKTLLHAYLTLQATKTQDTHTSAKWQWPDVAKQRWNSRPSLDRSTLSSVSSDCFADVA